ncbi:MAG: prephenate dehydrogenase/arogenate dehydrogenase family protein [Gemmatimonadota bacterium]|nr:prephenate dehydrogenase/arogenate dehydrogenase family protein [Gemmatimonadota bacterium]
MTEPVLIVGFGRFGRAIAGLSAASGRQVYAVDPEATVPLEFQAPQDLLTGDAILIVAVPVASVKEVTAQLAPELGPRHLVMDVSSVRSPAEEAMRTSLGERVPWIGTHPLFGPSSIALGERPLTVVVCPNELHPEAVGRAHAFYRSIGCEVVEEDPAAHDRSMAYSHALAFFLAKGLLDMDVPARTRIVPPSFRSMLQTIESVRSDAGHLFYAIEAMNPFAPGAREELMAALSRLHDELEIAQPDASIGRQAFEIPDLGAAAPELRETRELIDDLDHDIVRLIARRAELVRRVKSSKGKRALPVRDAAREREILQARRAWATEEGVDPDAVARIFEGLMSMARTLQADT